MRPDIDCRTERERHIKDLVVALRTEGYSTRQILWALDKVGREDQLLIKSILVCVIMDDLEKLMPSVKDASAKLLDKALAR